MSDDAKPDASEDRELTNDEMREGVIKRAFGGDARRYEEFLATVKAGIPPGTGIIMRGSSVTGERHKDGAPFDADGPGTSDLDLTLVGDKIHDYYILDGYYIPGLHSKPLSDKDPDIAPDLVPLREKLMAMVGRPVNIQATTDLVTYVRGELVGQPYLTMAERTEGE